MTEQEIIKNIKEDMTYYNKEARNSLCRHQNPDVYCVGVFRGLERTARYLGYGWKEDAEGNITLAKEEEI